jgi:hypothetical protein
LFSAGYNDSGKRCQKNFLVKSGNSYMRHRSDKIMSLWLAHQINVPVQPLDYAEAFIVLEHRSGKCFVDAGSSRSAKELKK